MPLLARTARSSPSRLAAGVVAACLVAACAGVRGAPATERGLRVMSYNIQYGGGGRNLDSIIGVIRSADADIVGLQEVDVHWAERSSFADQASAIAAALGMEVRFAPIYDLPGGARGARQFGVAVLSRHPITGFTNHPLIRLSTQDSNAVPGPRPGFLEATIDVHGTAVQVFNTHLDYRRDPSVRRAQVAEMLVHIARAAGPVLLLGDLNAPPEAPELQPLFTRLRDAWPAAAGPGHTIPVAEPVRRIDYVLISDHFQVRSARVPATLASDHRPVVIDLVLPSPRP